MIGDVGEKKLLRDILIPLVNPTGDPLLAGDDSGMFDVPEGHIVCASTDRVPWDLTAHRLGIMSVRELGYYLVALNISDIAAMGAEPCGLLLNFALPATFPVVALTEIFSGVIEASEKFRAPVLGGDLSDAPEPSLVATSLGVERRGRCLRRTGAAVGDKLYTTGPAGLGAAALRYFNEVAPAGRRLRGADEDQLRQALLRPSPQLEVGGTLARSKARVTAMDNTHGVSQSLFELAEANSVHYHVREQLLPIHPLVYDVAHRLGQDAIDVALGPGADFHLIGTVDDLATVRDSDLHVIGEVRAGSGVSISDNSHTRPLSPNGWNYFLPKVEG